MHGTLINGPEKVSSATCLNPRDPGQSQETFHRTRHALSGEREGNSLFLTFPKKRAAGDDLGSVQILEMFCLTVPTTLNCEGRYWESETIKILRLPRDSVVLFCTQCGHKISQRLFKDFSTGRVDIKSMLVSLSSPSVNLHLHLRGPALMQKWADPVASLRV